VIGGLVRILKELSATHADRGRYENLLREMLVRVKDLQQGDGFWRPSLLDPLSTPRGESSGTGFYLYGMAYAMRTGLVDKLQFVDHAHRAWGALVGAVDVDGRLGWVQPIGYRPEPVRFEDSDVFGTGAMLLGASEYLEFLMVEQSPGKL
jgi:rhamnogalacturonyl hydrolase YesR